MNMRSTLKTFEVSGYGPFPASMLRFDAAWPYTDVDANAIEASYTSEPRWTVRLQTGSNHAPTIGRWESFNCKVEEMHP